MLSAGLKYPGRGKGRAIGQSLDRRLFDAIDQQVTTTAGDASARALQVTDMIGHYKKEQIREAMKRLTFIGAIIAALAVIACTPGTEAPGPLTDADRAAISGEIEAFVEIYNRNDWQGLSAFFTEDAVLLAPNFAPVEGRTAIADWEAANEAGFQIALTPTEIDGFGDIAYVRGTSLLTYRRADGFPQFVEGNYLEIRRRGPDGRWLIARDIFNASKEFPEPAAP
ncbi:MAG: DUF4440 domain-containing protein [Pseudomonadota bacterium]